MATLAEIQQLYVTYFGRPADVFGLDYWALSPQTRNLTALQVGNFFGSTPEFQALAATGVGAALTQIYVNTFGRQPEPAGLQFWAQEVNSGRLSLATAGYVIANNASAADAAILANKVSSSQVFTDELRLSTPAMNAYSGSGLASGVTFLTTVTTAPATTAQTTAAIATVVNSGGGSGQSYTLTTASETATATRFISDIAISGAFALNTLNNGDRLTGSGSNSSLNATLNTAGNIAITPTLLSNIQTANFELTQIGAAAGTTALNFINSTGLSTVSTNTAGAAFTINNLATALSRVAVSNTAAAHTFAFADAALAGATNAVTVAATNFTGGVALNLNVATAGASAYETVNIESLGTVVNVFNVVSNGAGYTTINVSGAGTGLTTVNQSANLTVFNASTATGDITYTQGGEGVASYTGGSGNDNFILDGTYTNTDTVNGGAGTDRLTLTNAIAVAIATAQTNISNIETIGLSDALSGAVSVNLFGTANGFRFGANSAAVASTINYATGTNALDFQTFALGGALTVNVAGVATTDVLNITKGSTAAGSNFAANNVTINGAETVNILSQGGANTFQGLTLTNTAAQESVILTGTQNVVFAGAVGADVINASGMTGAGTLTLTGGTATSTNITGTANNDVLNGSAAADLFAGGAGDDTIANVLTGTAASAADVLTGGAGFDTFTLRGDQASAVGGLAGQYSAVAQITDFVTGSTTTTTDILQLSAAIANYGGGSAFFAGVVGPTAAGATGIQSVAQNAAAAAIVAGTDLVKLTTGVATGGLTAQTAFNAAIGTATVTGLVAGNDIFVSFYDTTNSRMVIGLGDTGADTVLATADVFTIIGSLAMSAADYAAFANTNLAIIAA